MVEDEKIGLPQSPAQAAEGDVRTVLELIVALDQRQERVCVDYDPAGSTWDLKPYDGPCAKLARQALAALSAEGSANTAAARLAAEEMRERAAEVVKGQVHPWVQAKVGLYWDGYRDAIHDAEEDVRALPLPPSSPEDQEKAKAAAAPTIADPDGEARS